MKEKFTLTTDTVYEDDKYEKRREMLRKIFRAVDKEGELDRVSAITFKLCIAQYIALIKLNLKLNFCAKASFFLHLILLG